MLEPALPSHVAILPPRSSIMQCTMRATTATTSAHCSTSGCRAAFRATPRATWSRPQVDRDSDFIKPSFVPKPFTTPLYQPDREEGKPLYSPPPEMPRKQSEVPDKGKELPEGPKMPERRPDPIPAGERRERRRRGRDLCVAWPMQAHASARPPYGHHAMCRQAQGKARKARRREAGGSSPSSAKAGTLQVRRRHSRNARSPTPPWAGKKLESIHRGTRLVLCSDLTPAWIFLMLHPYCSPLLHCQRLSRRKSKCRTLQPSTK